MVEKLTSFCVRSRSAEPAAVWSSMALVIEPERSQHDERERVDAAKGEDGRRGVAACLSLSKGAHTG